MDRLLRPLADLFLPATPVDPVRRRELWILFGLLVIATVLRLWGLGSFSLHKPDEDTTVLAAMHVLEDGRPQFPSGMFYARAILQSYLIGGSAYLFGTNEFAQRLPSALSGVLLVWLGWLAARRFLSQGWRVAFAAMLAFLPAAIADSQEARMYSFLVASLAAYLVLVFKWERTGKALDLTLAVFAMLLAIQFQEVALFAGLAVLFPGLKAADPRRLIWGLVALAIMGAGYLGISDWQGSFYPSTSPDYLPGWTDPLRTAPLLPVDRFQPWLVLPALIAAATLGVLALRRLGVRFESVMLALGFWVAFTLQALYSYHLAAIVWMFVIVVARRGDRIPRLLWVLTAIAALVLLAAQLHQLIGSGLGLRKALGQLLGRPSVWPFVQLASYSPGAALLCAAGVIGALLNLMRGRQIGEWWLFFALTIWIPTLAIGMLAWFLPPRYVQFAMLPLLLVGFAVVANLPLRHGGRTAAIVLSSLLVINPYSFATTMDGKHRFANHKAAADFVRRDGLKASDLVIAEDVLIQNYYLHGQVQYWLSSPEVAAPFVVQYNGRWLDQYTHAEIIDTVAALRRVLARQDRGNVYIIGSIEGGDRLYYRGAELNRLLEAGELPEVWRGVDGTRVWKVPPGMSLKRGESACAGC